MAGNKQKRSMLNTTINEDVLNGFRDYCKSLNIPMSTILETFMEQFAQGQFIFRLSKNKMQLDIEE
jgi:antitoxin component of RelBE/YafQ-DinJ toxin-antitoxin module